MADIIEKLFSLFCPTWGTVLKMFVRLFCIEQVKVLKKVKQELFMRKK